MSSRLWEQQISLSEMTTSRQEPFLFLSSAHNSKLTAPLMVLDPVNVPLPLRGAA